MRGNPIPTYTEPDHVRFVEDMKAAGLEVEHYHGRMFWTGPAVRVDALQDAMSETRVRLQYDQMGKGWIVYPVAKGGVENEPDEHGSGDEPV